MSARIVLYVTPSHVSITVENGARREATAPTLDQCIAALHPADLAPLRELALTIADILSTVLTTPTPTKLEGGKQ
jgi:hypothetical protein